MTRVKEVVPGSEDIPDYKSPPARIVKSLRQAYNNQRLKVAELRKKMKTFQIKTRDLMESREKWKKESGIKQKQIEKQNIEIECLNNELSVLKGKKEGFQKKNS